MRNFADFQELFIFTEKGLDFLSCPWYNIVNKRIKHSSRCLFSASAFKGRGNTVRIRSNSHCRELMDKDYIFDEDNFVSNKAKRARKATA
jgi:hypothetical protein